MQLSINSRETQGVVILELNGRFQMGEEVDTVRKMIHDLVDQGHKQIALNLEQVVRIDSTGIGMLVEAVIYTVKQGGQLTLFKVPRLVRSILMTHRLIQAFDIRGSEEEALAAYSKAPPQPGIQA